MLKFIGVVRQNSRQDGVVLLSVLLLPDMSGHLYYIVVIEVGHGKDCCG